MPNIIIHAPEGAFDAAGREAAAAELTEFALDCEGLPKSVFARSTVWVYFHTCPADAVFMGASQAYLHAVSAQVFVLAGGLDPDAKTRLIKGMTAVLGHHSGAAPDRAPVYVVVHEIPESNWGLFGEIADLAALRASSPDAPAL